MFVYFFVFAESSPSDFETQWEKIREGGVTYKTSHFAAKDLTHRAHADLNPLQESFLLLHSSVYKEHVGIEDAVERHDAVEAALEEFLKPAEKAKRAQIQLELSRTLNPSLESTSR